MLAKKQNLLNSESGMAVFGVLTVTSIAMALMLSASPIFGSILQSDSQEDIKFEKKSLESYFRSIGRKEAYCSQFLFNDETTSNSTDGHIQSINDVIKMSRLGKNSEFKTEMTAIDTNRSLYNFRVTLKKKNTLGTAVAINLPVYVWEEAGTKRCAISKLSDNGMTPEDKICGLVAQGSNDTYHYDPSRGQCI